MKMRLMPVVASLCGMFICASAAQANSVYINNKPVEKVATIDNVVYVPFKDLMSGLNYSWKVDDRGVVVLKENGAAGPELQKADFTVEGSKGSFAVQGLMRDGQVWVPVRMVKGLGYELAYNRATEMVDIMKPRLKTDADRAAEEEVNQARAEREAKLAQEREAEKTALEERKQALAELKAKKAKGDGSESSKPVKQPVLPEGSYDNAFEAGEAAAREIANQQKDIGGVETYSDLMKVQEQLDEQDRARRLAIYEAERKAREKEQGQQEVKKEEKAAPVPVPNLVVFAPRATPDYFTGHINMTATVRNIGDAEAKGLSATVSLIAPDGSVLNTQRVSNPSVGVNGQWDISTGYDHIDGSGMPHGNYQLRVSVDFANKPEK